MLFMILVTALLTITLVLAISYWRIFRHPLPRRNGRIRLPGLKAGVEVLWDDRGVPHVYAQSEEDLIRAQGFLHAQDRLWQMELNRRVAQGRLAEIAGRSALPADRLARILGFQRRAEAEIDRHSAADRQKLNWYVEGINAFLATHADRLPAEFTLLRIGVQPWQPADIIAFNNVMAWALSANWEIELMRAILQQELGVEMAMELEIAYPADHPTVLPDHFDGTATTMLLEAYARIKQIWRMPGTGRGSNSWTLSPERSVGDAPILANDPHLEILMPGTWYEMHLVAPGLTVSGMTFAGVPGVIIGHNEKIAWGVTNGFTDAQDLYVEKVHPDDPKQYFYRHQWRSFREIREEIRIRGEKEPYRFTVRSSKHGPIINDILPEADLPTLAVRWTAQEPLADLDVIWAINKARDWPSFTAALASWGAPTQNFTYADRQGNIGYKLAGLVPIRSKGHGLVPAPGWDADYEWQGWVPAADLPGLFNPQEGAIVTANNKIAPDDFPYFLGADYLPGFRAARITQLLAGKQRFDITDCIAVQQDVLSLAADELLPYLRALTPRDQQEQKALTILQTWDGRMSTQSVGAAIYAFTVRHLLDLVFAEKLGPWARYYLSDSFTPFLSLNISVGKPVARLLTFLAEEKLPWYDGDRSELLHRALADALAELADLQGNKINKKWQWGHMHKLAFRHPLGDAKKLLRPIFNRGPYPVPGDGQTIWVGIALPHDRRVVVAPSFRMILNLADWDQGKIITLGGQSGHPADPHYNDQTGRWLTGDYGATYWSRPIVEEHSVATQILHP